MGNFITESISSALLLASVSSFIFLIYSALQIGKRDVRMPKGPPTIPILGNAHQIPSSGIGKKFKEWSQQYGSVFSLKLGPANYIVLCDRESVNALLDKKGSIYVDRPSTHVGDIITQGDHLTIEPSGPSWKLKRSIATTFFSPKQLDEKHFQVQEAEAAVFMNNLLDYPDQIFDFAKLYTVSVATVLLWGQRAATLESFWNKELGVLLQKWLESMEPGANPPVDEFPFLKYLPGRWKTRAYDARHTMDAMWSKARQIIDERRARGDERDCLIDKKIDEYNAEGWPMSQHAFNNLFGELVEAGADTTANQILTIILALTKYPEVCKRAQKEIDAVCGDSRAPVFADFDKLPYINAIVKEGMRWRPTAHTALPHLATKDDEYKGMLIPKGSTIFIGVWALHMNEEIYADYDHFNPDRYLNYPKLAHDYAVSADYENRDHYGYGSGRRMCPGMHLAERSMWRITAKLLWAFDFFEPRDEVTGEVKPLDPDAFTSSLLVCPLPFKATVVPRSPEHLAAIRRELKGALEFLAPFE